MTRILPAALLALTLVGCFGPVPVPPPPTSLLRTPEPDPTATPTPTPTPTPTSAPLTLTGHVSAPQPILVPPLGLAATDGQTRLPLLDSGLLVNTYGLLADTPVPSPSVPLDAPIGGALVTLTDLAQRTYLANGVAIAATADANGLYRMPALPPGGKPAIVVAYPSGSQRLTALVPSGAQVVDVDLATTLATELLRNEASLAGRAPQDYPAASFAHLVASTRAALLDGSIPELVPAPDDGGHSHAATLFDLRLDQSQALRNQYIVAMSDTGPSNASIHQLSDAWASFLGARPRAITTVLGNGRVPAVGPSGVEGDQPAGAGAGDGTAVPLGDPGAVAVSARGDVFVACAGDGPAGGSVRWVQPNGRVTSVALPVPLQAPAGVAIAREPGSSPGQLVVADAGTHRVLRLAIAEPGASPAALDVVAGEDTPIGTQDQEPDHPAYVDGPDVLDVAHPATSRWRLTDEGPRAYRSTSNPIPHPARYARLNQPSAVAVDELGNIYIADRGNQRIRMVPAATGVAYGYRQAVDTDGDGLPDAYADLPTPLQVGCLYTIAGNPAWDPARTPVDPLGHWFGDFGGDNDRAQLAKLDEPSALAFADGFLYVADRENQRVRRIARDTGRIETVAGLPPGPQVATRALHDGRPTDFQFPRGTGGDGGPGASAQLSYPSGLALDRHTAGKPRLYVADQGSGRLRLIDLADPLHPITTVAGRLHTAAGSPDGLDHDRDGDARAYADLFLMGGLAVDPDGNVLLCDGLHRRLRKVWLQWE